MSRRIDCTIANDRFGLVLVVQGDIPLHVSDMAEVVFEFSLAVSTDSHLGRLTRRIRKILNALVDVCKVLNQMNEVAEF